MSKLLNKKKNSHVSSLFPPPTEDEKRCIFYLDSISKSISQSNSKLIPPNTYEENEKQMLELLPGRIALVDGINKYFIMGNMTTHTLEGYGYNYYKVILGAMGQTRKAVPPGNKFIEKFVPLGKRELIQYNNKLPVVVYLPKDAQLKYRVWGPGNDNVAEEH